MRKLIFYFAFLMLIVPAPSYAAYIPSARHAAAPAPVANHTAKTTEAGRSTSLASSFREPFGEPDTKRHPYIANLRNQSQYYSILLGIFAMMFLIMGAGTAILIYFELCAASSVAAVVVGLFGFRWPKIGLAITGIALGIIGVLYALPRL